MSFKPIYIRISEALTQHDEQTPPFANPSAASFSPFEIVDPFGLQSHRARATRRLGFTFVQTDLHPVSQFHVLHPVEREQCVYILLTYDFFRFVS